MALTRACRQPLTKSSRTRVLGSLLEITWSTSLLQKDEGFTPGALIAFCTFAPFDAAAYPAPYEELSRPPWPVISTGTAAAASRAAATALTRPDLDSFDNGTSADAANTPMKEC